MNGVKAILTRQFADEEPDWEKEKIYADIEDDDIKTLLSFNDD